MATNHSLMRQVMSNTVQTRPISGSTLVRGAARWLWLPAALSLWIGSSAFAITPEVKDNASLFSTSAVEKANRQIAEIQRRFHRDLVIETFPTVPKDKVDQVSKMDKTERAKFFEAWALSRAQHEEVNGIYALITKDPHHFTVLVGEKTRLHDFTMKDREHLADVLTASFKKKDFDGGLLEGVAYVEKTMAENKGEKTSNTGGILGIPSAKGLLDQMPLGHATVKHNAPVAGGGGGMSWVIWLIVIVLGLWFVLAILRGIGRAMFGGGGGGMPRGGMGGPGYGAGPGPGGYGGYGPGVGGGGGGGFMSGMLGGPFGAAAGNWLYDSFRGGGGGGRTFENVAGQP